MIFLYLFHFQGDEVTSSLNVTAPSTSQVLRSLKAGYLYTFHVRAFTVAFGPAGSAVINLKTYSKLSYHC